jgi:Fic family protein
MERYQWIWKYSDWPNFHFDATELLSDIAVVSHLIGGLEAISRTISDEEQIAVQERVLADDALGTAAIEGEVLRRSSVRARYEKTDLSYNALNALAADMIILNKVMVVYR